MAITIAITKAVNPSWPIGFGMTKPRLDRNAMPNSDTPWRGLGKVASTARYQNRIWTANPPQPARPPSARRSLATNSGGGLRASTVMVTTGGYDQRIGGAYWIPPLFQSWLSPRAMPSFEPAPTLRSKDSP